MIRTQEWESDMSCFDTDRASDRLRVMMLALASAVGLSTMLLSIQMALAQGSRVAAIATYQGPDREQRLIEGARREGMVTFYSNAPTDDNTALVGAFEKKYGIKVSLYRASSEEIRQRVLNEARA